MVLGLQHYLVMRGSRNCPTGRQRGRPRPTPSPQHLMDRIAMNERAAPTVAWREAVGRHLDHGGEILACQVTEWPGAAKRLVQCLFRPILRRDFRYDLLREYVERLVRDRDAVEFAAAGTVEYGGGVPDD